MSKQRPQGLVSPAAMFIMLPPAEQVAILSEEVERHTRIVDAIPWWRPFKKKRAVESLRRHIEHVVRMMEQIVPPETGA